MSPGPLPPAQYYASLPKSVALRALHLPAEPGVAYVAGEARDCQSARRHLIAERGLAPALA